MAAYYAKKAFEILRENGPTGLFKSICNFTYYQGKPKYRQTKERVVTKSDLLWRYAWRNERKKLKNKVANETDADPFKIIWVDPKQVQYVTGKIEYEYNPASKHLEFFNPWFSGFEGYGEVRGGDWDTYQEEFTELSEYKAIKQRYTDGIPWEKTDFFNNHLEIIRECGGSYMCESREELLKKCNQYERLLYNIKNCGYKTQWELGKLKPHGEIKVNIGRNGKILFNGGGRHRLSIAKVLELEKIPVNIRVRHTLWQELRDDIRQFGLSKEHEGVRDHPDLQDIRPDSRDGSIKLS